MMYGAPPGSLLHNPCILRKAVLVKLLQVSQRFFSNKAWKKRHLWQTYKSIVNHRASQKIAHAVGQEIIKSCKNIFMLRSSLVASQLLRTFKHQINFAVTAKLLVHHNKLGQRLSEHLHSLQAFILSYVKSKCFQPILICNRNLTLR